MLPTTEWYDKEHIPSRLKLDGFSSAVRYKTTDGKAPSWLAIYNVTNPEVLQSPEYKVLGANPTPQDKSIISRLTIFNRRIYKRTATVENTANIPFPSKYLLIAGLQPSPENVDDLDAWHKDEHWDLMLKVPGFVRARQFVMLPGSAGELGGQADPSTPQHNFTHLNLVDWEINTFMGTPEFGAATGTNWAKKVFGDLEKSDLRLFTIHQEFSK